jgi:hypothetical protein
VLASRSAPRHDFTELSSVAHQIRDLRAPNLILTGQAVDIGTGAPDIPALHDGSRSPGSRHLPIQELATLAAAEDQDFKPFWLSHALLCLCRLSVVLHRGGQPPPRDGARRARLRLAAPRSGRRPSEACRPSRGAAGPRHAPLCSCSIWRSSMRFQGGARGSLVPVVGRPLSQQTTRVPGSAAPPACVMARPSSRRRWSGRPGLTRARWRATTCCATACPTATSTPSTSPPVRDCGSWSRNRREACRTAAP